MDKNQQPSGLEVKPPAKGMFRCFYTILYSIKGIKAAWKYEESFRQELGLFVIAVPVSLFLGENALEIILMIFSVLLIMIVELLNSAVEAAIDRISTEKHELSGRAKDLGSAAVMFAIFAAIGTWAAILFSH